jgi:hypothetical protein
MRNADPAGRLTVTWQRAVREEIAGWLDDEEAI